MIERARRDVLRGAAGACILLAGCGRLDAVAPERGAETAAKGLSPAEDLMREHGALERLLGLYDECACRLEAGVPLPLDVLAGAARVVRAFVEDYHERLEQDFVFPRLERAGRFADVVALLRRQHQVGRAITGSILDRAGDAEEAAAPAARAALARDLRLYARMMRPHAAREDTVVFPALRLVADPRELAWLGERFEIEEEQRFGEGGFDHVVTQIGQLEQVLGIYDLERVTPAPPEPR